MSLEPPRSTPSEDDALLDADLLAIFGDDAPPPEPSDTPAPSAPEPIEPADKPDEIAQQPEDAPVPELSDASAPDTPPEESSASEPMISVPSETKNDDPVSTPDHSSHPRQDFAEPCEVWLLKNLTSASAAMRIEEKLRRLPGLSEVSVVYATQQLRFHADNPEARLDQVRRTCLSIDPAVEVIPHAELSHAPSKPQPDNAHKPLLLGAVFLAIGTAAQIFLPHLPLVPMFLLCLSYVILGGDTLLSALGTLRTGHLFDASTLFSLATLGVIAMGGYIEAAAVMLIYRIGSLLEHRAIEHHRSAVRAVTDLRSESVHRIDNQGVVHTIPTADAVPGDLLLIRPGDRIPLDGIVRAGQSRITPPPILGSRTPTEAIPGTAVYSGGVNGTGALQLEVTAALPDALVSRLADAVCSAAAQKSPTEHRLHRVIRVYTPAVVLIAVLTALIPSFVTGDWARWVRTGLSFLIAAYPGALLLGVPLSFFSGIGAGALRGILFGSGSTIEDLDTVRTVVLDQEQTVTRGDLAIQSIVPASGMNESALLSMAASCAVQWKHPFSNCIQTAAQARGVQAVTPSRVQEISGQGVIAMISGVTVLCGSRSLLETAQVDLSAYQPGDQDEVLLAAGGRFAGVLRIAEAVRPESKTAMKRLRALGLDTVLLSPNTPAQAEALSAQLDIQEARTFCQYEELSSQISDLEDTRGPVLYAGRLTMSKASVQAVAGAGAPEAVPFPGIALLTDDPRAIAAAFDLSRLTLRTARQNTVLALSIDLILLLAGFAGLGWLWLFMLANVLSSLLCLHNTLRILHPKQR